MLFDLFKTRAGATIRALKYVFIYNFKFFIVNFQIDINITISIM